MRTASSSRGQIVSLDLVLGGLFFLLALSVFIFLIVFYPGNSKQDLQGEFEILYSFSNVEQALKDPAYVNVDFMRLYRIDVMKMDAFADTFGSASMDTLLLGSQGESAGLGLSEDGYDTCMYFMDELKNPILMGSSQYRALGQLNGISCHDQFLTGSLCSGYKHGLSTFRPVLWSTGSPVTSKIVQMNVVACKK